MRPSYQGHVTLQGGFHLLDAYRLPIPGLPEKAELENQAWIGRPEAAIQIKCGNNINFNHCTFQHLAATGVDYERAVSTSIRESLKYGISQIASSVISARMSAAVILFSSLFGE